MKQILPFVIFLSTFFTAQVIKDSILGKPKFVKESVIFLNESGPFTFMNGDDEYGHAVIKTPENLRARMNDSWFETNFCRYINNETYYDKNRNIIKETWYYKSGEIVDDYIYTFDDLNRLITKISKGDHSERRYRYWYDRNSKTVTFKESYFKWKDESAKKYLNNMESYKPLFETRFDTLSKTDSIFAVTNTIWKAIENGGYTRVKDSIYHKKLSKIKIYDDQYRVIEEKLFNYESDFQNKRIYQTEHFKYDYDTSGNITKKTSVNDGKRYSYVMYGSGKIIKEERNDDAVSSLYTVYTYTKDNKLERKTVYYKDKVWHDIKFEYKNNYISKVLYLDKFGKQDQEIEPTIIIFKYKFDKQKNWTEVIKNVDGKDLYKWVRKIEYYY
ncbi:hypothetical protein [Chryseobacterium sp. PMSZPI]|uniref:hypothetical protein n=1 Tax=Chryseobacterium sp. PMSZPI TaxID=1033900 RepID=UPI000C34EB47|nr:hypothetical protein [Chryseobacterium sp. PMSZPI]PKF75778.1 hypothetical protein CW752_02425 [Chryseobacterium sp. PMSZPI]